MEKTGQRPAARQTTKPPTGQSAEPPCPWAPMHDPLYRSYHDEEWGVPEYDSRALWEKLVLDGFQAGLAWITILRKRETMRAAFDNFDPLIVANYSEADIDRLLQDPGIIRSRAKIEAAIDGARIYCEMQARGEHLNHFLWRFVDHRPLQNDVASYRAAPTQSVESLAMSKALKDKGFKFCGPVIVYAFMQAVGMVNDHELHCPRRAICQGMAASPKHP